MEKNKKISFKNFETLMENENGNLEGGFSLVAAPLNRFGAGPITNDKCLISNNCKGGNCFTGCGGPSSGSGGGY
jgi:hypothetical protein